jgi:adenosylcobyric acid synthase
VFASLVGTYELLEPQERNRFFGFLINKFRGDVSLFTPGISYLEERLAQTCLGVIPYLHGHGIDDEDSVSLERRAVRPPFNRKDRLCVCVVGLPYLSNFTDFTALENVPGVVVYYTRRPEEARAADVLILPGSKNTIPDLVWLRKNGWEPVIKSHAAAGKPLVGICGGFQMLGREIRDPHHTESDIEHVSGLNLLNFTTVLEREKVTRQATARFANPQSLGADAGEYSQPLFSGYEIHLGETLFGSGAQPLFHLQRLGDDEVHHDGAISADGRVFGTYLHGLFDSAAGLELLMSQWRRICGKEESKTGFFDPAAEREKRYDALADHFRSNLKMDVIYRALNGHR